MGARCRGWRQRWRVRDGRRKQTSCAPGGWRRRGVTPTRRRCRARSSRSRRLDKVLEALTWWHLFGNWRAERPAATRRRPSPPALPCPAVHAAAALKRRRQHPIWTGGAARTGDSPAAPCCCSRRKPEDDMLTARQLGERLFQALFRNSCRKRWLLHEMATLMLPSMSNERRRSKPLRTFSLWARALKLYGTASLPCAGN